MIPETFDAIYDGSLAFQTAFRASPLYIRLRDAVTSTPEGAQASMELTDEDVNQFAALLNTEEEKLGKPAQRREFPLVKALLQRFITILIEQMSGSGGLGVLIGEILGDLLNPPAPQPTP